ncbi:MAG: (Fe-S)-binding protein, partial [Candidatus Zixiibacteriota bacterium]
MSTDHLRPKELSREGNQLVELDPSRFLPLPPPYDQLDLQPKIRPLSDSQKEKYECGLDGITAAMIPKPKTEDEKKDLIEKFFSGLSKLFNREDNWAFLMPLFTTVEFCAKCQTCAQACPIFQESGQ